MGRARFRTGWVADESGAIAVFVAAGIAVFISMAALAVDLGMLMTARSEAQRTADGAALAGAASLIYRPNNAEGARQWAREYASQNDVRGQQVVLRDEDIDVIADTVRVRVLRTESYGSPVQTLFARMFGVDDVDVATVAAAHADVAAARVSCLLPVSLPDRWVNFGSLEWDPSEGDYYEPPYLIDGAPNPNYAGYGTTGELVTLLPSQGGQGGGPADAQSTRLEPGYWDLWLPEGVSGTSDIRSRIMGCPDGADQGYEPTDPMWREAGNRQTLADAFQDILRDPLYSGQYYDPSCTCARDSNNGNAVVTGGLRYRTVPVFDPNTFNQEGAGPHFVISHFIGVFVESVDMGPPGKANVYARIMPTVGSGNGSPGVGPLVRVLRLVE
jgi:hypothetical protein